MNIVYLDFDGVLTTRRTDYAFDPELFEKLRRLLEKADAYIVITSSWRSNTKEDTIREITNPANPSVKDNPFPFTDRIIGVTPRTGAWLRGQEIAAWFKRHEKHPEIQKARYVILDDQKDFLESQKEHLIQTAASAGLSDEDVNKAIKILNNENL